MLIREVTDVIERFAPLAWQESYDNAGLIVGRPDDEVHRALLAVDVTDEVMAEAERELHIEPLAMGDHAVLLECDGIFEVLSHPFDHLLPHLGDLTRESEPVVTLHQLRYQGIDRLAALCGGGFLLDAGGAVGGVDFTAQVDGEGHLAAYETQAAVLQREEPVRAEQGRDQCLHLRDCLFGN